MVLVNVHELVVMFIYAMMLVNVHELVVRCVCHDAGECT